MIFDEITNPVAHRFNDPDCRLSDIEKKSISFIAPNVSQFMWKSLISLRGHLSLIGHHDPIFRAKEKFSLNWELFENGRCFFNNLLLNSEYIFFFWGPHCCCITKTQNVINAWDDFFYISDESSVLIAPKIGVKAYSFSDKVFVIKNTEE